MQLNGCISFHGRNFPPKSLCISARAFCLNLGTSSVFQIQRVRAEVDNPVMGPKDLCPEQAGHRLRAPKQIIMNQALEINHSNIFAHDIDCAD